MFVCKFIYNKKAVRIHILDMFTEFCKYPDHEMFNVLKRYKYYRKE